jgi:hypothetical protein
MKSETIPDIENGYMINTYESYNRFQTYIECYLEIEVEGNKTELFLSSACRPEAISGEEIFNGLLYTFRVVRFGNDTYKMATGSSVCSQNPFATEPLSQFFVKMDSPSEIRCQRRAVNMLEFEQALALFHREDIEKNNQIFMLVEWSDGPATYRLIAPCRYTNFPSPTRPHAGLWLDKPDYPPHSSEYLQPISGPVLFAREGKVDLAYVAAHVTNSDSTHIEFSLKRPISFFSLRREALNGRFGPVLGWLSKSWLGRIFLVHEYHQIIRHSGRCRFFRYGDVPPFVNPDPQGQALAVSTDPRTPA